MTDDERQPIPPPWDQVVNTVDEIMEKTLVLQLQLDAIRRRMEVER